MEDQIIFIPERIKLAQVTVAGDATSGLGAGPMIADVMSGADLRSSATLQ